MRYSTYWRTTIFASIFLHFFAWLGFAYVLPHIMPEPTIEVIQEMDWIDVDLSDDESVVIEEDAIPIETIEPVSEFEFPPLIIPDTFPEPVYVEEPQLTPPPIVETQPQPESEPEVVKDEAEAAKKLEEELKKDEPDPTKTNIVVPTKQGKQLMGQPPVTVSEAYPPQGGGLNYKGYVSVAATIGKDGKVKKTKIMRTSGRIMVDNIAMNAASKWTFKPALDQEGKPMECDKIITFDFRKFI